MESSSSLDGFRLHANSKRSEYGKPDMVYLLTGHDVYSEENDGTKSMNVLGIGFVGGLCTDFFVALGEDSAGLYTGMHTMTHEAAHVLGAAHDQSQPKSWIKGDPGSLDCPWSDGHIMSYVDGGVKHHRFSDCSLKQIRNLVLLRGKICWRVMNTGQTEEGRFPGMEVGPNEFCKSVFPDQKNVIADMNSDRIKDCMIKCQYPLYRQQCFGYGHCYSYTTIKYLYKHALDFMQCGKDKVCVRGVCGGSTVKVSQGPVTESVTPEQTTPTAGDTTECRCDCSSTSPTSVTGYPARPSTPRRAVRYPYRRYSRQ
ncbi:A disintegrin and metalloproteinase with thrombospondin motifs like [Dermacentor andersoni]|uniref:A disintegrin and metalloproteinase with thrombospondin motifs like n=1 Tax=Dermacentor andersoni TaxID=34620 RepID=UPI003B3AC832